MSESLSKIFAKLAQVFLPIIRVLGIVGNSLNRIILSRTKLCNHGCSRYFFTFSSNNLINFFISKCLFYGWSICMCKILQYIASVCPFLCSYLIALASSFRNSNALSSYRRIISTNAPYSTSNLYSIKYAIMYYILNVTFTNWITSNIRILFCLHSCCISLAFLVWHNFF